MSDIDQNWWRQAVVYQVYPRSFADSNADGIGDLPGITARLEHIASLGVDAVWLSPFYPSHLADGGYDVDDYRNVDPLLGTLDDFDAMVTKAHGLGLKIVVDIVPNHSSNKHEWFLEALDSPPGSPARERYIFRDGTGENGENPPSDWWSHFGGPAWTQVPDGQWYCHLFTREQPDFNWDHPEVIADFEKTLRFWSDRGADGFRVDVAHALKKDLTEPLRPTGRRHPDTLTEIPIDGTHPLYDRNEVHDIFRGWREVLNEYTPSKSAVAEAVVTSSRRALYARANELGQAFSFEFLRASWSAKQFREIIDGVLATADLVGASATWVLSNHDVIRHPSRYALSDNTDLSTWLADMVKWLMNDGKSPVPNNEVGLRRARAATMLMLALPGSAYLYQGEELGLFEVADIPRDQLQDPIWDRTDHEQKGRDGCRVPIPWTPTGSSFGFGDGGTWLPQPEWFGPLSIQTQDEDESSTLWLYRQAMAMRRVLRNESPLVWIESEPDIVHFSRETDKGTWSSITNFGSAAVEFDPANIRLSSEPISGVVLEPGVTAWSVR